jgi:hypothetical protein
LRFAHALRGAEPSFLVMMVEEPGRSLFGEGTSSANLEAKKIPAHAETTCRGHLRPV